MSKPTESITILVNGQEYDIPTTVETEPEILREMQFDPNVYALYWDEDVQTLGEDLFALSFDDGRMVEFKMALECTAVYELEDGGVGTVHAGEPAPLGRDRDD